MSPDISPSLIYRSGDRRGQGQRLTAKRRPDPGALQILGMPVNFQMFDADADKLVPRNLMDQNAELLLNDVGVPIELHNGSLRLRAAPTALCLFESSWRHLAYDSNVWLEWMERQISQMRSRKTIEADSVRVTIADNLKLQMIAAQMMMQNQLSGTIVSRSHWSWTTPAGGTPPAARDKGKRSSVISRGPAEAVSAA